MEFKFFRNNYLSIPVDTVIEPDQEDHSELRLPAYYDVNTMPDVSHELRRENRFLVSFPEEVGIESWMVQSITKPSFTVTEHMVKWHGTILL